MGRATVAQNLGEGLYRIRLDYDMAAITAELAKIAEQDNSYSAELAAASATMYSLERGAKDAQEAANAVIEQWLEGVISAAQEDPPTFDDPGWPPGSDPETEEANDLFTAVNAARTAAGRDALTRSTALDAGIGGALAYLVNARRSSDTQRTPEQRVGESGFAYDAEIGAGRLISIGHLTNAKAIAYWQGSSSTSQYLLSADMTHVGVAARYSLSTPGSYLRGILMAAPGATTDIDWPETDPAKEKAEEAEAELERIELPQVDVMQPEDVQAAVAAARKAASAYEQAEKEVARIKLEAQIRDKRKNRLEQLEQLAADTVYAWACSFVDDLEPGEVVTTAEVPGWLDETETARTTTMGVRNDPGGIIPSYYVDYLERSINVIGLASVNRGNLRFSDSMSDAVVFVNAALEPGHLKWKPQWRYGTVTARTQGLCSVTLDSVQARYLDGSEVAMSLDETLALEDVPISFLTSYCWSLITVGAEVLIEFTDQDRTQPRIIGWRREPLPCGPQRIGWGQIV